MSAEAAPLRVVFMGTPEFSADILQDLQEHQDVVCVYTQPDRVRSRGKKTQPTPVKERAEELGLDVHCLSSFKDADAVEQLRALEPDVICVAAFGALLPKSVLDIPRFGCINVHASILPRWRGAAPIERAILAGDEELGVCIMRMEEGLDTGDFCICRRIPAGQATAPELTRELAHMGGAALMTALAQLQEGSLRWTAQDEAQVTYASKIEKHELYLDPADDADTNVRRVRASSSAHPAKCSIGGRPVTVLSAALAQDAGAPEMDGKAQFIDGRLQLGCAQGAFVAEEVKPDGKRAMAAADFAQGMPALKTGVDWAAL